MHRFGDGVFRRLFNFRVGESELLQIKLNAKTGTRNTSTRTSGPSRVIECQHKSEMPICRESVQHLVVCREVQL